MIARASKPLLCILGCLLLGIVQPQFGEQCDSTPACSATCQNVQ